MGASSPSNWSCGSGCGGGPCADAINGALKTMPWRDIVAYGFAIGVCQFGLLFLGLKLGMPAGLSSLVIQVQVFFTIGLAVAFAGDHLRRHNIAGAAIAVVGMIVLALYKVASGLTGTAVGFALAIAAPFAWAGGNITPQRPAA